MTVSNFIKNLDDATTIALEIINSEKSSTQVNANAVAFLDSVPLLRLMGVDEALLTSNGKLKLFFNTSNVFKRAELENFLSYNPLGQVLGHLFELMPVAKTNVVDTEENTHTMSLNAVGKVNAAITDDTAGVVLGDDSGIIVPLLNKLVNDNNSDVTPNKIFPGVISKRLLSDKFADLIVQFLISASVADQMTMGVIESPTDPETVELLEGNLNFLSVVRNREDLCTSAKNNIALGLILTHLKVAEATRLSLEHYETTGEPLENIEELLPEEISLFQVSNIVSCVVTEETTLPHTSVTGIMECVADLGQLPIVGKYAQLSEPAIEMLNRLGKTVNGYGPITRKVGMSKTMAHYSGLQLAQIETHRTSAFAGALIGSLKTLVENVA